MNTPRRIFLKSATFGAVSGLVALSGARSAFGQIRLGQVRGRVGQTIPPLEFPVPLRAQKDFLFHSSYSTFTPYIGSIFTARGASGERVELRLTSVTPYAPQAKTKLTTRPSRYYTDCCSLMFTASGMLPPFSDITSLRHAALGKIDFFLAPKGQDSTGFFYEAVLNHITTTPPAEYM